MIATGFDSAFFQQQAEEVEMPATANAATVSSPAPEAIDTAVNDIDMDLSHTDAAAQFASENTADIWNQPVEEDDDDTPAFLRRRKKNKSSDE